MEHTSGDAGGKAAGEKLDSWVPAPCLHSPTNSALCALVLSSGKWGAAPPLSFASSQRLTSVDPGPGHYSCCHSPPATSSDLPLKRTYRLNQMKAALKIYPGAHSLLYFTFWKLAFLISPPTLLGSRVGPLDGTGQGWLTGTSPAGIEAWRACGW